IFLQCSLHTTHLYSFPTRRSSDLALGIREGDKIFHLERLRYINEQLWSLADAYVSYSLCPELIQYDFTERSLHNTLSNYGHIPARARRRITARQADEYEAFNLGLQKGDPACV